MSHFCGYSRRLDYPYEPTLVWPEPERIELASTPVSDKCNSYDIRDDDIDVQLPLFPELTNV